MVRGRAEILRDLAGAVFRMEETAAIELALESLEFGIDPHESIKNGLCKGMEAAGKMYESGEYFIPHLLLCSDAMYGAMDVLQPHFKGGMNGAPAKIVLGVVEGDVHDLGKNLVRVMLETSRFEVQDLGRDVPSRRFVEEAVRVRADMICMSALMTTTMRGMDEVIRMLETEGMRETVIVMIGGGPVSQGFADRIGADGYAANAAAAAEKAKELLKILPNAG